MQSPPEQHAGVETGGAQDGDVVRFKEALESEKGVEVQKVAASGKTDKTRTLHLVDGSTKLWRRNSQTKRGTTQDLKVMPLQDLIQVFPSRRIPGRGCLVLISASVSTNERSFDVETWRLEFPAKGEHTATAAEKYFASMISTNDSAPRLIKTLATLDSSPVLVGQALSVVLEVTNEFAQEVPGIGPAFDLLFGLWLKHEQLQAAKQDLLKLVQKMVQAKEMTDFVEKMRRLQEGAADSTIRGSLQKALHALQEELFGISEDFLVGSWWRKFLNTSTLRGNIDKLGRELQSALSNFMASQVFAAVMDTQQLVTENNATLLETKQIVTQMNAVLLQRAPQRQERKKAPIPNQAPRLSNTHIPRAEMEDKIARRLIEIAEMEQPLPDEPLLPVVVCHGAGGMGKSELARAVIERDDVRKQFKKNGILYLRVGRLHQEGAEEGDEKGKADMLLSLILTGHRRASESHRSGNPCGST